MNGRWDGDRDILEEKETGFEFIRSFVEQTLRDAIGKFFMI